MIYTSKKNIIKDIILSIKLNIVDSVNFFSQFLQPHLHYKKQNETKKRYLRF